MTQKEIREYGTYEQVFAFVFIIVLSLIIVPFVILETFGWLIFYRGDMSKVMKKVEVDLYDNDK